MIFVSEGLVISGKAKKGGVSTLNLFFFSAQRSPRGPLISKEEQHSTKITAQHMVNLRISDFRGRPWHNAPLNTLLHTDAYKDKKTSKLVLNLLILLVLNFFSFFLRRIVFYKLQIEKI